MNLSSNCTFEAKNIRTIESINSFSSSKVDDTISITSKTSKKRKYKMKDLDENDRKLLLQEIQTKSQENKEYKKITFAENSLQIEYIIKYLHSYVRFEILENNFLKSTIESFSTRSIKSTTNFQITRQFVEIIKNSAKHKVWRVKKAKSEFSKSKTDINAYITISNKKENDNTDWTLINEFEKVINQVFVITDIMRSIINTNEIWMIEKLNDKKKRDNYVKNMTNKHITWKIRAHKVYKNHCNIYMKERINWEWNLFQVAVDNYLKFFWSTNLSIAKIMELANLKAKYLKEIFQNIDARELVKQKETPQKKDEVVNQFHFFQ